MSFEKAIVVTRKTRLEELVARFNTRPQAKFYIERSGGDFLDYEREHDAYRAGVDAVVASLERLLRVQVVDRGFMPTFRFAPSDLVLAVGQDGMVANTAKYVGELPLLGVNPEPARFDGVLLPFHVGDVGHAVARILKGSLKVSLVTLAEVRLDDGQRLLAFNDLFVGVKSHTSARYRIALGARAETHSSSGLIVSTGAGSTGWLSSMWNMAAGLVAFCGHPAPQLGAGLRWEDERLVFVVREPFASRASQAGLVAGSINAGEELRLESLTPAGGVIFSDGIESDFLAFNSGAVAHIRVASHKARLAIP